MNRRALEALRAFVEAGSVAKAGERLLRSSPHISRLLSEVEIEAGFAVFARQGRKLTLTDRGHKYYSAALRLLAAEDEFAGYAKRLQQQQTAYIRIISAPFLANAFINTPVMRMLQSNPQLAIDIDSHTRIDAEAILAEAGFDFAIVSLPLISGAYEVLPFLRVQPVVAMNAAHPLAALEVVSFRDLCQHELIVTHPRSGLHQHLAALSVETGLPIKSRLQARNGIIACQLAGEPMGCCVADPFMALSSGASDLVVRPFATEKRMEYGFVLPRGRGPSELISALMEDIRATTRKRIEEHRLTAELLSAA